MREAHAKQDDPVLAFDGRQSEIAAEIQRGVCRALRALGLSVVTELPLANGRRADVVGLSSSGDVLIVEIKSCLLDYRTDGKWQDYLEFCDRLYFAVADGFHWFVARTDDVLKSRGEKVAPKEVETALMSLGQPGVQFCKPADAKTLARRCNDYSAELNARHGKRFGAFGTVSMWNINDAVEEVGYCLDTLRFSGVSLFASYDGTFLGDHDAWRLLRVVLAHEELVPVA